MKLVECIKCHDYLSHVEDDPFGEVLCKYWKEGVERRAMGKSMDDGAYYVFCPRDPAIVRH
ncbi:hypothetical protein C4544_04005 [candidate division WS5 bacterium]|uniref:Uncharacterized protein n=1 Tax=candidate division WS5 bacterium TaxID=2093353 RepID=A0A419DD44_9BACT|nr:MAG: hypothetical protein C4544_04005 [candidate division WS5 bacterium]